MSSTEYLHANGFLTPNTVLAHSVWPSNSDRKLISDSGAFIAHNPTSNLKLASGVFDYEATKEAGIPITISTDGPASNNDVDMIEEVRLASFLAKGSSLSPTVASAKEVLYSSILVQLEELEQLVGMMSLEVLRLVKRLTLPSLKGPIK